MIVVEAYTYCLGAFNVFHVCEPCLRVCLAPNNTDDDDDGSNEDGGGIAASIRPDSM